MTISNTDVSDWTECPRCTAENDRLGGGTGYADDYFNHDGGLWAVCRVHAVRWCVTRALIGVPDAPPFMAAVRVVDPAPFRPGARP